MDWWESEVPVWTATPRLVANCRSKVTRRSPVYKAEVKNNLYKWSTKDGRGRRKKLLYVCMNACVHASMSSSLGLSLCLYECLRACICVFFIICLGLAVHPWGTGCVYWASASPSSHPEVAFNERKLLELINYVWCKNSVTVIRLNLQTGTRRFLTGCAESHIWRISSYPFYSAASNTKNKYEYRYKYRSASTKTHTPVWYARTITKTSLQIRPEKHVFPTLSAQAHPSFHTNRFRETFKFRQSVFERILFKKFDYRK